MLLKFARKGSAASARVSEMWLSYSRQHSAAGARWPRGLDDRWLHHHTVILEVFWEGGVLDNERQLARKVGKASRLATCHRPYGLPPSLLDGWSCLLAAQDEVVLEMEHSEAMILMPLCAPAIFPLQTHLEHRPAACIVPTKPLAACLRCRYTAQLAVEMNDNVSL